MLPRADAEPASDEVPVRATERLGDGTSPVAAAAGAHAAPTEPATALERRARVRSSSRQAAERTAACPQPGRRHRSPASCSPAVVLLCFFAGPPAVLVLVVVAVTLAAAELFNSLRLAGYRPATLLGLLAVPGVIVAAYFDGPDRDRRRPS